MPPLPKAGPEPPQNRSLAALAPDVRVACEALIVECARRGIGLLVTETARSKERQDWLWSIGRTHSHPATGGEKPVTWTQNSRHLDGRAFDVVPMRLEVPPPGAADPTAIRAVAWWGFPAWEIIGAAGEKIGLRWGGRWTTKDLPHFEM